MAKNIPFPVTVTVQDAGGTQTFKADSAGICGNGTKVTAINLYHKENTDWERPAPMFVPFTAGGASSPTEPDPNKPYLDRIAKALETAELALLDEAQRRAALEEEAASVRRKNKFALQREILLALNAGVEWNDVLKIRESAYADTLESLSDLQIANTNLAQLLEVG